MFFIVFVDPSQMIKRHGEVEHLMLHYLRQMDADIEDITFEIELQDLCQYEKKMDKTGKKMFVGKNQRLCFGMAV